MEPSTHLCSPMPASIAILCSVALSVSGCGPKAPVTKETTAAPETEPVEAPVEPAEPTEPSPTRRPAPESGPTSNLAFPKVTQNQLRSGLEVNVAQWSTLPLVYAQVTVRSGAETNPEDKPGLARLVADMMPEGIAGMSSSKLAEAVEGLGADLWVDADEENLHIGIRALAEHLDTALQLLADVTIRPIFRAPELDKYKTREYNRLTLQQQQPQFLARRAFQKALYGDHPYGTIETTRKVVKDLERRDLLIWHRRHVVPNNAFLVVVGDVDPAHVNEVASNVFGDWEPREVAEPKYAPPPEHSRRQVIIVDRPGSVQSVIRIGNLAIERASDAYIPLTVINQVLGGSASSRLFMDLREKRSLTYGAYSFVQERSQIGAFAAGAAVRTEVTAEALDAFFEHLDRVRTEPPSQEEFDNAKHYIRDRFPIQIDTPRKILSLMTEARTYGLPNNYWESFRQQVGGTSMQAAQTAAQRYIRPGEATIVIVGDATEIKEAARKWGDVTITDIDGKVTGDLPMVQ